MDSVTGKSAAAKICFDKCLSIAKAEARFFPDMAVEAIASAVAFYQKLDNWGGDIAIDRGDYEAALDVFEHSKLITSRHSYDDVITAPPEEI